VPACVLVPVVMVTTDVPELLLIEAGLNPQLAPLGKPEHESVTALWNPKVGAAVTVDVAKVPAITEEGLNTVAENIKPGGVVLSCTAIPNTFVPTGKTMSGSPSLFISAITTGLRNGPLIARGDPKLLVMDF